MFADTELDYCDSKFDKKKNSTRSNISQPTNQLTHLQKNKKNFDFLKGYQQKKDSMQTLDQSAWHLSHNNQHGLIENFRINSKLFAQKNEDVLGAGCLDPSTLDSRVNETN